FIMQKVKAITKYVRISPYKARRAADLVRNMKVEDAVLQLKYSSLKGARLLLKALDSAIANAETQLEARKENLKIAEVKVDGGPTLKRSKARNKGGQSPIMKRTSHFTVVLTSDK
ncbi:MAG: 50S ribosomal protein L22, partial [Parachlamydiales bacterium]